MSSTMRRQLMKYLHGELDAHEAREIERSVETDPEARRELEAMRRLWEGLESPQPAPAPEDFAARTLERVQGDSIMDLPPGLRWAAVGVMLAGMGLGISAGLTLAGSPIDGAENAAGVVNAPPSLAERYLALLEEAE